MSQRVVLFDLDETLVQEVAPVLDALRVTCELAGLRRELDPLALATTLRSQARAVWEAAPTHTAARALGISSWEGLRSCFPGSHPTVAALRAWAPVFRTEVWGRALADHGITDPQLVVALAAAFPRERAARHAVYADAEPALRRLVGAGAKLGLLTNGPSDLQRQKIAASGLGAYFEAIVVSGEVGVGKPDAAVFRVALDQLGAAPVEATMVGDTLARDIAGARAVGIRSVWLNRRQTALRLEDPLPDLEIRTLDDL